MPKKEFVRKMFDSIAGDYDKLNHIMSADVDKSWRRTAIKKIAEGLPDSRESSMLDLACGTGDFSIAAAKKIPALKISGADLSEGMLEVMRKKVMAEDLQGRISMATGDGENLSFPDGSFDRVSIAFGIRNFENREAGLKEMNRVLRPGGRLVVLELSVPENALLRGIYKVYFTKIMPALGGAVSGDKGAYRYLPASVLHFPGKEEFLGEMARCGFINTGYRALSFGICRMYWGEKKQG